MSAHCGHNASILGYLDSRADCLDTMRQIHARCEERRGRGVLNIQIAFVCKSGKHRSVGMATALRLALLRDSQYQVRRVVYCTDLARECRCRMCPACTVDVLSTMARQSTTQKLQRCWPARAFQ